jgi:hypothetical protein
MFSLLLACIAVSSNAQVLERIQQNFKQYNDHVLQEKIYVHTDKSFYLSGEILWFKVYNVDAGSNAPVNISKVAYVDVLDDANTTVLQAKVELKNGAGNGSFYIPVTLKNGNYKLRAYTNWMKNFGPAVFFEKAITIVNLLGDPTPPAKITAKNPDIQFFAEGGNLVSGVQTTVGFKVTGAEGNGMQIAGVVVNQRNDTVARFQTLKFGMGSFLLTPQANATYKAIIRIGNNNALIKELPPVNANGYAIHLTNGDNTGPGVKISTRGQGTAPLYLFVHSGHKVVVAQALTTDANGDAAIQIDKAKLGAGINHFTLFNGAGQPVCERLYFNRPHKLNLRADAQLEYKLRSPVALNITAKDQSGAPQLANMSVSVFKLDSLNNAADEDIASYLWLGSELKGYIESPGYYFDVVTAETDKALDNLLLTQGWSRFTWHDALANKPLSKFTYLPEYNGHIITGKLTNIAGQPAKDVVAYLGVVGKRTQLYGAVADSTGQLLFNTKELYGPGEIVVQTNNEKDSTYRVSITNPFSEQYNDYKLPALQLSGPLQNALESNSVDMQVQNIYSADKIKQYNIPVVDSGAFYGDNYKTYKLDAFTRFTTMEEDLREYVAEINVVKQQKRFHIKVISPDGFLNEGDPLVLLDGVPVFNMDKVFTINPLKINKLEMVNHVSYWGPVVADGVLNYTSYKGDLAGFEIDPRAVVLDYEGMQLQRQFYSPVYDTPQQQKSRLPDFRSVLYWAPDVNTDAKGNAKVSFYTSDKAGKYVAVFQGLTSTGKAGSCYFKFDVSN